MSRPQRLVVVIGTATDIGKTWVGGQVLSRLRAEGITVAARKPAQSADADDTGPSDAEVLADGTGEPPEAVCRRDRTYTVAMAPPMAADALGLPVPTAAELLAELAWPDPAVQVGWLETVGGPRSPIASDGDAVTFIEALAPDVVLLVADAGLGTVNAVLTSLGALGDPIDPVAASTVGTDGSDDVGTPRRVVFLNRFDEGDDLHRRNLDWLRTREGLEVIVDLEALSRLFHPQRL